MKELTLLATLEATDEVLAFVDEQMESYHCDPSIQLPIDVAVEELYVNIAHYAYRPDKGPATVRVDVEPDPLTVIITFLDEGMPYDPLSKSDPDFSLPVEARPIGGLGIYMVKNSMDAVEYRYENGRNILTIRKQFHELRDDGEPDD